MRASHVPSVEVGSSPTSSTAGLRDRSTLVCDASASEQRGRRKKATHDMRSGPLAWLAEQGLEQVRMCDQVSSRMPTSEEADNILRLQAGTPVTDHVRTGYDMDDKLLRVTVTILPGDRFVLRYELTTDD